MYWGRGNIWTNTLKLCEYSYKYDGEINRKIKWAVSIREKYTTYQCESFGCVNTYSISTYVV